MKLDFIIFPLRVAALCGSIQYCIHGTVYTVLCTQYCIHTLAAHQAPAQWSTRSRHMCPTYFGKCFLMPIERFWRTMSVTCVWTRSAHMAPALWQRSVLVHCTVYTVPCTQYCIHGTLDMRYVIDGSLGNASTLPRPAAGNCLAMHGAAARHTRLARPARQINLQSLFVL